MIRNQFVSALLLTVCFAIGTGLVFPGAIWLLSQVMFPKQANGSLISYNGEIIGSDLIGQNFLLPKYFHPRPSAAAAGYDPLSSGGPNLGPTSKKLFQGTQDNPSTEADESFLGVADLIAEYRLENHVPPSIMLPVDAVTRSASGLDPHISVQNALLQLPRVAQARGISETYLKKIVNENIEQRFAKIFGEPRINVLRINLLMDQVQNS